MAGLAGILALAIAAPPTHATPGGVATPVVEAPTPATRHHARRPGLEERVAALTKALDLDARQEAALRKVLQRQREEVRRIWSDESMPSANRVFLTKAVSKHTGDEIRALLNEEQRKKYDPPPQGDAGAVTGSARVEDWMKGSTR